MAIADPDLGGLGAPGRRPSSVAPSVCSRMGMEPPEATMFLRSGWQCRAATLKAHLLPLTDMPMTPFLRLSSGDWSSLSGLGLKCFKLGAAGDSGAACQWRKGERPGRFAPPGAAHSRSSLPEGPGNIWWGISYSWPPRASSTGPTCGLPPAAQQGQGGSPSPGSAGPGDSAQGLAFRGSAFRIACLSLLLAGCFRPRWCIWRSPRRGALGTPARIRTGLRGFVAC